jgi:hypothetical protein
MNRRSSTPINLHDPVLDQPRTSDKPTQPADWKQERLLWLVRCMRLIAARIERGEYIGDAINRVARTHDGKPFKTDPRRRLAASTSSLRRHWDRWKTNRTPESLGLKYVPGHKPVSRTFAEWFAKRCLKTLAPVSRTITQVRKEWLAGRQLPGLKRRKSREHWPLHSSTLHRLVSGEQIAEVLRHREQMTEAAKRMETLSRRIINRAARKGGSI